MRKDVGSIIALLMGTGGAQLITLIFTPFLTRMYSPEAFGHLGVFMSLAAIFVPIVALTLPMAIVIEPSTSEAKKISILSLLLASIISMLLLLVIITNNANILLLLNASDSGMYFYWLPLLVFFSAVLQVNENWTVKLGLFTLRAKVSLFHSMLINSAKLLIGFWLPSATTLIFIAMINPLLNAALLFKQLKPSFINSEPHDFSFDKSLAILKKHQDFPKFQAPQALINALTQSAPVIILATFFGPVSAGFYTFSRTILAIPIMLLGSAMGDVFYSRIAKEINMQQFAEVKKYFIQATAALAGVGLFPLTVILIWGPEIFSFCFGENWNEAGVYAQWLSLWTFFILINSPSLKIIIALKQQKRALLLNIFSTPIRIVALIASSYYLKDELLALQVFVLFSIIHNLIIILLAYSACNKKTSLARA